MKSRPPSPEGIKSYRSPLPVGGLPSAGTRRGDRRERVARHGGGPISPADLGGLFQSRSTRSHRLPGSGLSDGPPSGIGGSTLAAMPSLDPVGESGRHRLPGITLAMMTPLTMTWMRRSSWLDDVMPGRPGWRPQITADDRSPLPADRRDSAPRQPVECADHVLGLPDQRRSIFSTSPHGPVRPASTPCSASPFSTSRAKTRRSVPAGGRGRHPRAGRATDLAERGMAVTEAWS